MHIWLDKLAISPLEWSAVGTSLLCGAVIGFERQLRGKPVGVRTSILICLGTYIFVALGATISGDKVDPSRIMGQVISGIGFLGAGVILAKGEIVVGVTSAATVWILAGIGCLIGLGHNITGVFVALVCVGMLVGVERMEHTFKWLRKGVYSSRR